MRSGSSKAWHSACLLGGSTYIAFLVPVAKLIHFQGMGLQRLSNSAWPLFFHVLPLASNPSHTLRRYDMEKHESHRILSPRCYHPAWHLERWNLKQYLIKSYKLHHLQTSLSSRERYPWNMATDEQNGNGRAKLQTLSDPRHSDNCSK